jgi:hypothetical protein
VENCGKPCSPEIGPARLAVKACSACAGDYEDPDRTAPGEDVAECDDGELESIREEDFLRDGKALRD